MPKETRGSQVRKLLGAITGQTPDDAVYINKKVYGRKGTKFAKVCGVITNTSICRLEGCGGARLHAKWPDGHRTYLCAKAVTTRKDGDLEIT